MFETLKSTITSALVLSFPDHNKPKMVETNASKYTYGAVLSQLENNTWKPLAFMSRMMQPAEANYNVYDKELLAIIKALEEWEQYLPHFGGIPMIIISNHQNLQYFMTT